MTYRDASNKGQGVYLISQVWGGCLFEGGRLFEAKIWGKLFNNPVSRVGSYSRVGAYSRGALNRSITVVDLNL